MTAVGIRELKNNLSKYVREVERGKRVAVTAHGRIVAELVPPGNVRQARRNLRKKKLGRYEQLVADGIIRSALEDGDPFEGEDTTPVMRSGEALAILDSLRGER